MFSLQAGGANPAILPAMRLGLIAFLLVGNVTAAGRLTTFTTGSINACLARRPGRGACSSRIDRQVSDGSMLSVATTLVSPDNQGHFGINGTAQGGYGTLHAGMSSSLDVAGSSMEASSVAQAAFEDVLTIRYDPLNGQPGLLYLSYTLSGSGWSTGQNTSFASVRIFAGTALEQHHIRLHSSTEWGRFSPQAIRFTYGVPFGLELILETTNRLGAGTVNLVESLAVSSLMPEDQQGNLVKGAQVVSASGTQYGMSGVGSDPAPTPSTAPFISSLHPSSGPPGTTVTVSGTGFLPTGGNPGTPSGGVGGGNNVYFGSEVVVKGQNSADGLTFQFDVPQNMAPGTYSVSVRNENGASNSVNFTVTAN